MIKLVPALVLIAVTAAGAAMLAPSAVAADCGSFKHGPYRYLVNRTGDVTCKTARKITRSFVIHRKSWTRHGDGSLATTTYTNRTYPGWGCGIASAAGGCSKGSRRIGYEVR